jgi:hypothetical protein
MLLRVLCFGFVFAIYALADEGMWLLPNRDRKGVGAVRARNKWTL